MGDTGAHHTMTSVNSSLLWYSSFHSIECCMTLVGLALCFDYNNNNLYSVALSEILACRALLITVL